MTTSTRPDPRPEARWVQVALTLVGAGLGPSAAMLYETGQLDLFRAMPLLNTWLVVLLGVIGVGVGGAAVRRGTVLLGLACLVTNLPVTALYGFLAAFFSFGGSR